MLKKGRVVSVGSGAGPKFVEACEDLELKKRFVSFGRNASKEDLESLKSACALGGGADALIAGGRGMGSYGLSKAALSAWGMWLAQNRKELKVFTVSPGFIDTAIVKGWGASKTPEEGTVALRRCLFEQVEKLVNGGYYGSDGVRSPLHFMRNPGEEEYDGKEPEFG